MRLTVSAFPKLVVVESVSVADTTTEVFVGIGLSKHKEFVALIPVSGLITSVLNVP
jgi:hypothetical protein